MILAGISVIDMKQGVHLYDDEERFADFDAAQTWVNDEFGRHKRANMYVDLKGGGSRHIGYVFSRWNHYDDGTRYNESVWVEFAETTRLTEQQLNALVVTK